MGGRQWDNDVYPPSGPFFRVFLPICNAGDTEFVESQHLANRFVRRHLNEHKKFFEIFFGVSGYPLGGPKMAEKLEISRFYHILVVFGHFCQFKHEKPT